MGSELYWRYEKGPVWLFVLKYKKLKTVIDWEDWNDYIKNEVESALLQ